MSSQAKPSSSDLNGKGKSDQPSFSWFNVKVGSSNPFKNTSLGTWIVILGVDPKFFQLGGAGGGSSFIIEVQDTSGTNYDGVLSQAVNFGSPASGYAAFSQFWHNLLVPPGYTLTTNTVTLYGFHGLQGTFEEVIKFVGSN